MDRLLGKVALITGGARGQGAAEARAFVAEGAQVMIADVLAAEGLALATELGPAAAFVLLDVTDEEQWAAAVDATTSHWGGLDVLVNNAGIFQIAALADTSVELFRRIVEVNQVGVFLGMRAVAPVMSAQQSGSIVNISSIAGLRGSPMAVAYSSTKWAVRGMTKAIARELAPFKVRVNSVHPGIIDTAMAEEFDRVGARELIDQQIPWGREATADEVAALVVFLASDESSYCTGGEYSVDGGMSA